MESDVRFAFYLVEPVGLEDALKYGVKAEEYGFHHVAACENLFWWTHGQSPVWDNFTVLTTILSRTKKIRLLTNVIDPVKRHPAIVAHMVSTLDNIAKGRIAVGVGAGEIANFGPLLDLARPYPSMARMKEFITVMRGVWDSSLEEPFNFEGKFFRLKNAFLSLKPLTRPHPPIYVAAMGQKMREFVAEIADGWVPITYTPETYRDDWKEIQEKAKLAARAKGEIDPALTVYTIVLKGAEKANKVASARGRLELAARPQLLSQLGYPELADHNLTWARRSGPLAETTKEKDLGRTIPEEVARRVTISGTPDQAIEQIAEFIKAGVRLFILWPPYEDENALKTTIGYYKSRILPYFAKK